MNIIKKQKSGKLRWNVNFSAPFGGKDTPAGFQPVVN